MTVLTALSDAKETKEEIREHGTICMSIIKMVL